MSLAVIAELDTVAPVSVYGIPARERYRQRDETITLPRPVWLNAVQRQIDYLLDLPPNWDRYGAPRIRRDVLYFASELLSKTLAINTPAPELVPMSHGGVQVEWHMQSGKSVTIEVEAPGDVLVTWKRPGNPRVEWNVGYDFESLSEPINNLS